MLVHRRVTHSIKVAGTHVHAWVAGEQEHNARTQRNVLARARTQTARSGVERTNHEATAPPTYNCLIFPSSNAIDRISLEGALFWRRGHENCGLAALVRYSAAETRRSRRQGICNRALAAMIAQKRSENKRD